MNWNKLKDYECPKCEAPLEHQLDNEIHACTQCEYTIGVEKFNQLITKMNKKRSDMYDEPDRSNWW